MFLPMLVLLAIWFGPLLPPLLAHTFGPLYDLVVRRGDRSVVGAA